jgi:hypothetical protein
MIFRCIDFSADISDIFAAVVPDSGRFDYGFRCRLVVLLLSGHCTGRIMSRRRYPNAAYSFFVERKTPACFGIGLIDDDAVPSTTSICREHCINVFSTRAAARKNA